MSSACKRGAAAPCATRATLRASSYGMPNLCPFSPVRDVLVRVSTVTSGLMRSATGATTPRSSAIPLEQAQLRLGLHVDEQHAGIERLAQLPRRLADAAEDDVLARKPARSARNSSPPETTSTPEPARAAAQQPAVGVRLQRVVHAVRHRRARSESRALLAHHTGAVHVRRRADRLGDALDAHALACSIASLAREAGEHRQYALAHRTSCLAGSPVTRQCAAPPATGTRHRGSRGWWPWSPPSPWPPPPDRRSSRRTRSRRVPP
jgi:hypothetical protein